MCQHCFKVELRTADALSPTKPTPFVAIATRMTIFDLSIHWRFLSFLSFLKHQPCRDDATLCSAFGLNRATSPESWGKTMPGGRDVW
jgi:hypothetical protein